MHSLEQDGSDGEEKNLILPSFRQAKQLMNLSRTLVPHADSSHPSSLRVSETNHASSVHCVNIDQADESVVKTVTGLYVPTNPVSDTNTQKVPDMGFVISASGTDAQQIGQHTLTLFN